jgi:hypothetical protein
MSPFGQAVQPCQSGGICITPGHHLHWAAKLARPNAKRSARSVPENQTNIWLGNISVTRDVARVLPR